MALPDGEIEFDGDRSSAVGVRVILEQLRRLPTGGVQSKVK
jgi:hypothetical protein